MTLQRGSAGPEVTAWQTFLVSQGANLVVDGDFGVATEDATKAFQRAHALTADGVVGPATQAAALAVKPSSSASSPAPASTTRQQVAAVKGIEKLKPSELAELAAAAAAIGVPIDWLATVISFETGGTFSPRVLNAAGSGAVGLIQFMPATAQALLHTATPEEGARQAAAMTFGQQLQRMVVPYFAPYKGRLRSLDDLYLAVFYPAFLGKGPADVVAQRDGMNAAVYRQNAGFDRAGRGYITKADITSTIRSVLASARGVFEFDASAVATVAKASALPLLLALGGGAAFFFLSQRGRVRAA